MSRCEGKGRPQVLPKHGEIAHEQVDADLLVVGTNEADVSGVGAVVQLPEQQSTLELLAFCRGGAWGLALGVS